MTTITITVFSIVCFFLTLPFVIILWLEYRNDKVFRARGALISAISEYNHREIEEKAAPGVTLRLLDILKLPSYNKMMMGIGSKIKPSFVEFASNPDNYYSVFLGEEKKNEYF